MPENETVKSNSDRRWVTMVVLIGAVGGLLLLSMVTVAYSGDNPTRSDTAQKLFNALLPVFGTWVGTVLAFYFSKDNFEAASKSMTDMAGKISGANERLKQIPVREKMRALKDITSWPMKPGEEDKSKIIDILSKFARLDRILMIDDKGCVVYLVYKNMVNQFLSKVALDPAASPGKATAATFKTVLDSDPQFKDIFQKSFGFVAENATLADAKRVMETVTKTTPCNDVFVTQTGQPNESIIGWITDNTIAENLKV